MLQFYLSRETYRIAVFLLIMVGALSLLFLGWQCQNSVELEYNDRLQRQLGLSLGLLKGKLQSSENQVGFLHATPPITGIMRAISNNDFDPQDKNSLKLWRKRLQIIFKAFVEQNPSIKQIRYIGAADEGRELVRVDRTPSGVIVVADTDLQHKAHSEYFNAASHLEPGQTYLSDINLNREHGQIELPAWPTYRALKSVFDDKGNFFGFVVVNYNAQMLLNLAVDALYPEQKPFLLNESRQFLIDSISDSAFAFEYGNIDGWSGLFSKSEAPADLARGALVREKTKGEDYVYFEKKMDTAEDLRLPVLTMGIAYKKAQVRKEVLNRQLGAFSLVLLAIAVIFAILYLYRQYSEKSYQEMLIKARLQAFVNGSKDAIITMGADAVLSSSNSAACEMFDRKPEQIVGQNFLTAFVPEGHRELATQEFAKVLKGHELPTFKIELNSSTKDVKYLEVTLSPKKSSNSELFGVAAIIRDITAATELEDDLKNLNDQLKDKNSEMEHFVYAVSHDLKAPLVTIGSFSQRILETAAKDLSEKNIHRLDRIIANTKHMESLVVELLNISRVIHSELTLTECDIKQCFDEVLEILATEIHSQQATLKLYLGVNSVQANKNLLLQCFQNLVANALAYRRDDITPEITVATQQEGDVVRISVTDNGVGIDPINHDKVFKLFEHISDKKGTGVGLTITKSVMEKHLGWVELDSKLGEGSTFTLCFPQLANTNGNDDLTRSA